MAEDRNNKRNANYDFNRQVDPKKRMGAKAHANLPQEPKFLRFGHNNDYRDGIINSFTNDIVEVSDIRENQK
jgi:hypothetical protein